MQPDTKASALWGVIGTLSFLVLIQAYHLLGGAFVGFGAVTGVAASVGVVSAGLAHLLRPRLRGYQR